jgi:ABC-2 type transport system permease protein
MTGIWRIMRYEFWRTLRRRGYQFATFGIPVLAIVIYYGVVAWQQAQANRPPSNEEVVAPPPGVNLPGGGLVQTIGVVDLSDTISETDSQRLALFKTEAEAQQALREAKITYYYLIAADYLETGTVSMHFERITLSNIDNRSLRRLLVDSLMAKHRGRLTEAEATQLVTRIQTLPSFTPNTISAAGDVQQSLAEGANFGLVYIFALVLLFVAFTTSGYLMQSVVEEKETRMVEVVLSSVRPRDLLAGKVLALSALGLIQMVLWFGALLFILNRLTTEAIGTIIPLLGFTVTPYQIVVIVIYFVLGYLYFAASYAVIGAVATNMREGPQIAAVVTLPAAVPLWATSLFAIAPDGPVPTALSIIPFTSPIAMVMRATISEVPVIQVVVSAALLLATVVLMMWLAGRVFRVNVLLSGQMPTLRDLVRVVRETA